MAIAVVGGASGVGRELVSRLHDEGLRPVIVDRNVPDDTRFDFRHVELADADSVIHAAKGMPDDLTAVALVAGRADRDIPGDIVRGNYLGLRSFMSALAPELRLEAVVSVSSISASSVGVDSVTLSRMLDDPAASDWESVVGGLSGWDEYRLSKWLIERWTLAQAASWMDDGRGIRANVVSPGAIATPMLGVLETSAPKNMLARGERVTGRYASPAEVADVIAFLLGPRSSWLNGVTLRVDGGLMNYYEHRRGAG